eukprot:4797043-Amphidinium_carterae.1
MSHQKCLAVECQHSLCTFVGRASYIEGRFLAFVFSLDSMSSSEPLRLMAGVTAVTVVQPMLDCAPWADALSSTDSTSSSSSAGKFHGSDSFTRWWATFYLSSSNCMA